MQFFMRYRKDIIYKGAMIRLIENLLFTTTDTRDDSVVLLNYSREVTLKVGSL